MQLMRMTAPITISKRFDFTTEASSGQWLCAIVIVDGVTDRLRESLLWRLIGALVTPELVPLFDTSDMLRSMPSFPRSVGVEGRAAVLCSLGSWSPGNSRGGWTAWLGGLTALMRGVAGLIARECGDRDGVRGRAAPKGDRARMTAAVAAMCTN